MKRNREKPPRPDKRKISKMFRAVERDDRPKTYYGLLVSDDYFRVVCFAAHDGDQSHFKERVLLKREYSFTEITKSDLEMHVRRSLYTMDKDKTDKQMEFEAAEANSAYAREKFKEMIGR